VIKEITKLFNNYTYFPEKTSVFPAEGLAVENCYFEYPKISLVASHLQDSKIIPQNARINMVFQ
jgi:hypothetical protein